MKFNSICFAALVSASVDAASWTFSAAKFEIAGSPYSFDASSMPISLALKPEDKFKLLLTIKEDETPKKPHQAMLLLKDSLSSLEANLVVPVKANGRAALTVGYKELGPALISNKSIDLTLVIGGFGDTKPLLTHIATMTLEEDPTSPIAPITKPLRYGALPEITHTFRAAQKMPPAVVSFAFGGILVAGLVGLFVGWISLGANVNALPSAISNSPISYTIFIGSLIAMESALFMYWSHLKIMAALGFLGCLTVPVFFSGRIALRETEKRRKAGLR